MEYQILETPSKAGLEAMVIAALAEGWVLQGGVGMTIKQRINQPVTYYAQAMSRQNWAKILSEKLQEEKSNVSQG